MKSSTSEIVESTLPAIAAGEGPFVRVDTGNTINGHSMVPGRGAGQFGIPGGVEQKIARAVEVHEYQHLSMHQFVPEHLEVCKMMVANGVPDNAIQAALDYCVNRMADGLNQEALKNLYFEGIKDGKTAAKAIAELNNEQIICMGIRAASLDHLRSQFNSGMSLHCSHLQKEGKLSHDDALAYSSAIYNSVDYAVEQLKRAVECFKRTEATTLLDTASIMNKARDALCIADASAEQRAAYMKAIMPAMVKRGRITDLLGLARLINATYTAANGAHLVDEMEHDLEKKRREMENLRASDIYEREDEEEKEREAKPDVRDADDVAEKMREHAMHIALSPERTSSPGRWCPMMTIEAPFKTTIRNEMARRRVRYGLEGPFRYPHRISPAGDGSCFSRKRKTLGGTLLIDCSGSMSLSSGDIAHIIDLLPASLIAGYDGDGHTGYLMIFAREGKMIDLRDISSYLGCSGNCVDGPALEWLIKQKKPHIWVSDGMVTGEHDHMSSNLHYEAHSLVVRNRVIQLPNLELAKDYVARHKTMFLH